MVHFAASLPHFADHLAPIRAALPEQHQGQLCTPFELPDDGQPVAVASYVDLSSVADQRRPVIYVEHGAGQTYDGANLLAHRHPSYSGSNHRAFRRVALFICPNEVVAGRWNEAWPDVPAVAIGCPKLDRWHLSPPTHVPGVVAWTWHWDCVIEQESGTALREYQQHLPGIVAELGKAGVTILGHGHPRWQGRLEDMWLAAGATYTDDPDVVFENANLLVLDNTSLGPEFASTNRPIVWVNSKRWRRHVHHGGRFWEWPEGQPQINRPEDAVAAILEGLHDHDDHRAARQAMVDLVYAYTDGSASRRAAAAIVATVG